MICHNVLNIFMFKLSFHTFSLLSPFSFLHMEDEMLYSGLCFIFLFPPLFSCILLSAPLLSCLVLSSFILSYPILLFLILYFCYIKIYYFSILLYRLYVRIYTEIIFRCNRNLLTFLKRIKIEKTI